jgi:hypothetical protein
MTPCTGSATSRATSAKQRSSGHERQDSRVIRLLSRPDRTGLVTYSRFGLGTQRARFANRPDEDGIRRRFWFFRHNHAYGNESQPGRIRLGTRVTGNDGLDRDNTRYRVQNWLRANFPPRRCRFLAETRQSGLSQRAGARVRASSPARASVRARRAHRRRGRSCEEQAQR